MGAALRVIAAAVVVATLAGALPAHACPVCWGASDDPMAEGTNNAILFLLAVVGTVQVGFVALFVSFRKRTRHYEQRKDSLQVIDGGVR